MLRNRIYFVLVTYNRRHAWACWVRVVPVVNISHQRPLWFSMVVLGRLYTLLRRELYQTKSFRPDKIKRGKESVRDLIPYTTVNKK